METTKRMRAGIAAAAACGCLLASSRPALTEERWPDAAPEFVAPIQHESLVPERGGASDVLVSVPAYAFDAVDDRGLGHSGYNRYSSVVMLASLQVPTGALLTSVELRGCDDDPAGEVQVRLLQVLDTEGGMVLGGLRTGEFETPGCGSFRRMLETPTRADNAHNSYYVEVVTTSPTSDTRFRVVRVRYRLEVSPAPAMASFPNDVPIGHPFFRFIEALAAAGISGGCDTGSYCPDSPVTRGQMAVFLATALGLHFPN